MSRQPINIGTDFNAGDGEAIRTAFGKVNAMMEEIYSILTANGLNPDFLPANSLLNAKLAQMPALSVKGNLGAAPAAPSDVSLTALSAAIGVAPSVSSIAANSTVLLSDIGRCFVATSSLTLALPAVAAAGNGFSFRLVNASTGIVTIDPDAAETVNGAATLAIYPGETLVVLCDGSTWRTLFSSGHPVIAKGSLASAGASLPIDLPSEFSTFQIKLDNFKAASGSPEAYCQFRVGGSYLTTGYIWSQWFASTSSAAYNSGSSGPIGNSGISLSSGSTTQAATDPNSYIIDIFPGDAARVAGIMHRGVFASYSNSGGGRAGTVGRADRINFLMSGSINVAAGVRYSVTGIRN